MNSFLSFLPCKSLLSSIIPVFIQIYLTKKTGSKSVAGKFVILLIRMGKTWRLPLVGGNYHLWSIILNVYLLVSVKGKYYPELGVIVITLTCHWCSLLFHSLQHTLNLTKSINIKQDLLLYLPALITAFKIRLIWHYDSTCHKCLLSAVKLDFADKHSILSITNYCYPHRR